MLRVTKVLIGPKPHKLYCYCATPYSPKNRKAHLTVLNEVVAMGAFLLQKYTHLFMLQYMLSKSIKEAALSRGGTNK